ncbi:MAG TPA: hypothetical protein VGP79_00090, partial [Bryobacteraceae bacterium]|nr:hypothetical protein [Bryobacteraceae bacterium]
FAQNFEQRGFIENQALFYPQAAPNDSAQAVDQAAIRWEASYKLAPWLKLSGAMDARADTHRQINRYARLNLDDRTTRRPSVSLREFNATIHKGTVTAEFGRQIIRWGKTDILTPTDRFAPKDYLSSVVDSDFLAVPAARITIAGANDSLDAIWQPWFTPSRTPLLDQRWTALPPELNGVTIVDVGARYPGRSQFGLRWNHIAPRYEYSLSYFDGFNNLPLFNASFDPTTATARAQRFYPSMRMYGADAAIPLPWLTVKGEAGYFTSTPPGAQDYVLYVIQVERQVKEWSLVGGYAGEAATRGAANPLSFTPDRGFSKSFVGHATLTIDVNRSLTVETAVRAAGSFVRFGYSQAFGEHWRVTPGVAWIRGDMTDFLGQYHRNSYASLAVRYSF